MSNTFNVVKIILSMAAMLFALNTHAHSRYILPSHTVLSGEDTQFVTLSASISNDIFHPDMPLGDDGNGKVTGALKEIFKKLQYVVTEPDGASKPMTWHAFSRYSIADLELKKPGTYKATIVQPALLMATFKKADGNRGRVFGAAQPPKGATDIVRRQVSGQVVSYVTFNKPNKTALKPTGKGLELTGESHPNDLFVNEKGRFQLMLNGKAANDVEISVVKSGTKHRNQREKISVTTDKKGAFDITFAEPGFYLLEAEKEIKAEPGAAVEYYSYGLYVTFEVFPE